MGHSVSKEDAAALIQGLRVSSAACSRAGHHFATLAAVAAALPGCAVLDGQAVACRWAWRRLTKPESAEPYNLWVELTTLVGEEEAWLGWLWASVAARLRRETPLAMLLARWVAVLRPDLALHAGPLGRLVAMLRDQESGTTSRSAPRKGVSHQPEELYAQLAASCGRDWQQALLVDLLPRGADSVLEIFRAVLREDELTKSQTDQATSSKDSTWRWSWARRCKNAKVAEAIGACRAAIWARRPGIHVSTEADLLLASIVLRLFLRVGVVSSTAEDDFDSFAVFARQQLNLEREVDLLKQLRSALTSLRQSGMDAAAQVAVPRPIGHARPEVAIVSWEDGICLSEVVRRPPFGGCYMEEGELSSRRAAARHLARTFWLLLFEHRIALGGLCAGNVLLRTAMDDDDQLEVVLLRCGLCHQVDAETVADLKLLTQLLRRGADSEEVGHLILTRVHCRSGGQAEQVRDLDGFFSSINSLLGKPGVVPSLRGALLLHRFLEILHTHKLQASEVHLQVATSAAATHAVCCRLDPFSHGGLFEALMEVAAISEG